MLVIGVELAADGHMRADMDVEAGGGVEAADREDGVVDFPITVSERPEEDVSVTDRGV